MKKFLVLILILLSVGLAGCGNEAAEINNSIQSQSYQGIIEELPTNISGLDVTHVVVTEAKTRVYLRSLIYDLSEYNDKKVKLYGTYYQEEIGSKPVDVITVTSIDLIDNSSDPSEFESFESSELGLSIKYDANNFEIDQSSTRLILTSLNESGAVMIKLNKVSPEVDVQLYLSKNYKGQSFKDVSVGGQKVKSNIGSGSSKFGYIVERDDFFYDLTFIGLESLTRDEIKDLLEEILSSFEYSEIVNDFFDVKIDEIINTETDKSNQSEVSKQSSSSFSPVINRFQSVAKNYLPEYMSSISYSFTDNNYFYVVYIDKNSKNLRSLFKYSDSSFELIASFERGTTTDWSLVSGDNLAYDRPQTVVLVSSDGVNREISVQKGYRYFESLPLGFGIQYPQNWYYTRSGDAYYFANESIDEATDKVKVSLVKSPFDSAPGSTIKSNMKRISSGGENGFSVKVNDYYVIISGPSLYEQQITAMADSIQELVDVGD